MYAIRYLELSRIAGVFTAVSNVLMGYLLSNGDINSASLFYLLASTSLLYCAGMSLNDFFDYRSDMVEYPKRVIPSGRITRGRAGAFGFAALLLGCGLAAFNGPASLATAGIIAALIIAYNRFSKKVLVVGALNMAAIRFFNVLLGSSSAGISQLAVLGALAIFVFVFGITMISRREGAPLRENMAPALTVVGSTVVYLLALHALGLLGDPYIGVFIAAFILAALLPCMRGIHTARVERLVGSFVLSIILLDASLVAGAGQTFIAALIALLYIPSFLLGRAIKVS